MLVIIHRKYKCRKETQQQIPYVALVMNIPFKILLVSIGFVMFMLKILPNVGQALDIPRHFSINEKDGFVPSDIVLIIRND